MTSSQEALILFAVVVAVLVYVKGTGVDIPFIPGGQATNAAFDQYTGAGTVSPGFQQ